MVEVLLAERKKRLQESTLWVQHKSAGKNIMPQSSEDVTLDHIFFYRADYSAASP